MLKQHLLKLAHKIQAAAHADNSLSTCTINRKLIRLRQICNRNRIGTHQLCKVSCLRRTIALNRTHSVNNIITMNQGFDDAAHILIPHHAKNKLHPLARIILIQRLAQCLRTIGIMSTI